jgi:hypothetical protein
MQIVRKLQTVDEVDFFLRETIQIGSYLQDPLNQSFLPDKKTVDEKIHFLVNRIVSAEKSDSESFQNNTLKCPNKRFPDCRSEDARKKLYDDISVQLLSEPHLKNDDQLRQGSGGMLPTSGKLLSQRKIIFIIGSPASGKSSFATKLCDHYKGVILDSDFIKRLIPEYTGNLNGAALVHEESKLILTKLILPIVKKCKWNIIYPIVGSRYDEFAVLAQSFSRRGYDVSVVLTELDRIKATQRALKRFVETGRYVSLSRILDDYSHNSILTFYKMLFYYPKYRYVVINADFPIGTAPSIIPCNKRSYSLCGILKK